MAEADQSRLRRSLARSLALSLVLPLFRLADIKLRKIPFFFFFCDVNDHVAQARLCDMALAGGFCPGTMFDTYSEEEGSTGCSAAGFVAREKSWM